MISPHRVPRWKYTLLAAPLVFACATGRLTGKDMVVLAADPGPECTYLSTITGVNPWGSALDREQDEVQWARRDASEKAAQLGATHIWFEPSGLPGRAPGKAYQCAATAAASSVAAPAAAVAAPPTGVVSGCTKDVDCKGDRICEGGRCVDPAHR